MTNLADCKACGGSGFSGRGTGYDDVCGECGGQRQVPVETPQRSSYSLVERVHHSPLNKQYSAVEWTVARALLKRTQEANGWDLQTLEALPEEERKEYLEDGRVAVASTCRALEFYGVTK